MKKSYAALSRLCGWLDKVILTISGVCLAALTILIFIQVMCRYVFSNSLSWSEEIARYLEVWIVFMCGAYALGRGQHICMDLVVSHLAPKAKFIIAKINACGFVFFSGFMLLYSTLFMISERTQRMASLNFLPKNAVYLALPVSAAFMMVYSLMILAEPREEAAA